MSVEKLVSKKSMILLISCVLLIAGILFCISPAIGENAAGIAIGIGVLLVGVIWGLKDFLAEKTLISRGVIIGSIVAALGIYFMVDGSIVSKIIGVIPYILIVTGACVIADSILLKLVREKKNTTKFALELSVGIIFVVLGCLILSLSFFRKALAVIIGILLIIGAIYYLAGALKKTPAPAEKKTETASAPAASTKKMQKSKSAKK